LTTKIHLVCDAGGVPLAARLSAGQRHDASQFEPLLDAVRLPRRRPGRPRTRPAQLVADRGYDARRIRRYLRRRGIRAVIPERRLRSGTTRRRRGRPPVFDKRVYAKRNVIERLIGWLKECRRLATRHEKYAQCYLAMVKLAFIRRCFRKLEFSDTA
jgi:transposase